jgi:hypothetical protein
MPTSLYDRRRRRQSIRLFIDRTPPSKDRRTLISMRMRRWEIAAVDASGDVISTATTDKRPEI